VTWVQILPLAFVMIAGPQIITSFFLATSDKWAKASVAFIGGAAIGITALVTIAYIVGTNLKSAAGSRHSGAVGQVIDSVVLALLVFLAVRAYLKRHESEPPKWMSGLEKERPKGAFLLGLALLSVFPTDIASNIAAGLHVSRHGAPWWQCLPFVGLTLLLLAGPALMVVVLGNRANEVLPKMRDWMNQNAWVVSEIVLAFLAAITIKSLVSG
jgi:Sap, sulfolipid-1-addressing protein